jgi:general secretion pathway protein I
MSRMLNVRGKRFIVKQRGFTLIEVLIALIILAVALAAAMRANNASIDIATDSRARLAANVVVKNRIAELQTMRPTLDIGVRTGNETQMGVALAWKIDVASTPNALIRRVTATAGIEGDNERNLANLTAYLPAASAPSAVTK